ncbi:MAG: SRPBCC family protein [Planctomycetota bacterium]|jgi:uncharacterized protein YndB with AHSA1/START domain
MIKREDDGLWVQLEETIASHHDEVFGLLTTSGGLTRWFPVAAEIDLRQGGQVRFCWDPNCKKATTVAILDYDPGGRVVWDWYADHRGTHAPVYWTVMPSLKEGTRVQMRQGPYREDVDSLLALAAEAVHWQWYLCNLRGVLEVGHDMRKVRPL